MEKESDSSNFSFIDLLFICLFGMTCLFFLAFLMIAPPPDEQQKKPKAEFLVTLTWNGQLDDDIDLWMRNPLGDIMFFRDLKKGFMHLDHDDLGHSTDRVVYHGNVIIKYVNQEIGTIRGIIPGEWIINTHLYRHASGQDEHVNVRVDKLNPKFQTIVDKNFVMTAKGNEVTVTRMTMNSRGDITYTDDLFYSMVKQRLSETLQGGPP